MKVSTQSAAIVCMYISFLFKISKIFLFANVLSYKVRAIEMAYII